MQRRRDGTEATTDAIANTPAALRQWLASWPALEPGAARIIGFEQPCRQLLTFFHTLADEGKIRLYALNPMTPAAMRHAFTPSRDKTDTRDAQAIADVLTHHEDRLTPWQPPGELTRRLGRLVEDRRRAVEERTALTNALIAILKESNPQAREWVSRGMWRKMSTEFLRRWPTLADAQAAKPDTLRKFYHAQGCRDARRIEARLQSIAQAVPLTTEPVAIEAARLKIVRLAEEAALLTRHIERYDKVLNKAYASHPEHSLYDSLPGCGPVFGPRLAAVLGQDKTRYQSANDLQSRTGIAPIRRQSGKKDIAVRRVVCPQFERQTFHEWAGETIPTCFWAKAFYQSQIEAGKLHHSALRALAYKWQRILWRCWQDGQPYDGSRYEAALKKANSPLVPRIEKLRTEARQKAAEKAAAKAGKAATKKQTAATLSADAETALSVEA